MAMIVPSCLVTHRLIYVGYHKNYTNAMLSRLFMKKIFNKDKESKQKNLAHTIYNDMDIFHTSALLFDSLWDKSIPIRALCVGVGHLSHEHDRQLSLFDTKCQNNTHEKEDKLQKAIDEIRKKYGNDKIMYADMKQIKK